MTIQKTLRGYQADLYRRLNRARNNGRDAVMLLPTGAGKTAIARNHCSHVLNHQSHFGIKRIIITTPQKQILEGFKRTNNEEWFIKGTHSSQKIDNVEIIEIPNESIGDFLKGSSGGSIAISCIQSITNQRSNAFNPFTEIEDCSSILWVIDEAHHIEAEQTAIVIQEFKKKNGKILYLTATPFNSDGALRILNNPDVEIIHRSLGEHMKDGFAPELDMTYEMFDVQAGSQTNFSYFKSDVSKMTNWAECISKQYDKDNRPKTLIVIPSFSRSGDGNVEDLDTANAAECLKEELEKLNPGIKILVAVGNDSSGEISRKIEEEAKTPQHDIIIACRRFDEGTDVPDICAVYHVGMTGCRRIIQLMGRALRNKHAIPGFSEKYPEYVDKSIFKFFIFNNTKLSEEDVENKLFNFSLQAIKTINAVQNFRSYDVISGAVRIRKNLQNKIEKLLEEDPENPDIEILEELISDTEQPIISLETAGENDDSMLALLAHNKMGHTNEEALENSSEVSKAYVESVLLSNELQTADDVENFVQKSIDRKRIKRNTNVISEELQELVNKYAKEQVMYYESDLIKRFVTSINKNTLEEWGDVLWDTYDNEEKQLEQVKEIVKFYEENGELPSSKSKILQEKRLGQKLQDLKKVHYNKNHTHLLYKKTVEYLKTVDMLHILENINLVEKQLEQVKEIVKFYEENGSYPSRNATNSNEMKLNRMLTNLKYAFLHPKDSTTNIYQETIHFLKSVDMLHILENINLVEKQLEQIKEIVKFYEETGETPNDKSIDILEKRLGQKLSQLKKSYNNKEKYGGAIIYKETIEYLNSVNKLEILENVNREEVQLQQIKDIIKFYEGTGKTPNDRSIDILEKRLGQKLKQLKQAHHNELDKTRGKIYQGTIEYLKLVDMLHILENINLVEKQLEQIKEIVKFYEETGEAPNSKSKILQEKRLGQKLRQLKNSYNNPNAATKIYQNSLNYLIDINMLYILENVNREEIQLQQIKDIIKFYEKNNRLPKQKENDQEENDQEEKRLNNVLRSLKSAYCNPHKTNTKIYQKTIDYLKSIDMLYILENKRKQND